MEVVIGCKYGRWTVENKSYRSSTRFLCSCECGTFKYVLSRSLLLGISKSCGCGRFGVPDYSGEVFRGIRVVSNASEGLKGMKQNMAICECFCGVRFKTRFRNLKSGHTKSCGCLVSESSRNLAKVMGLNNKTHGMFGTYIYSCWNSFKDRVRNPKSYFSLSYPKSWLKFESFYSDIVKAIGVPVEGLQLDRRDNSKGYSIENIRWATPKEQAQNRSTSRLWTTLDNQGVRRTFNSCREASSFFKVKECTMRIWCNGRRYSSGKFSSPKVGFSSKLKYEKVS